MYFHVLNFFSRWYVLQLFYKIFTFVYINTLYCKSNNIYSIVWFLLVIWKTTYSGLGSCLSTKKKIQRYAHYRVELLQEAEGHSICTVTHLLNETKDETLTVTKTWNLIYSLSAAEATGVHELKHVLPNFIIHKSNSRFVLLYSVRLIIGFGTRRIILNFKLTIVRSYLFLRIYKLLKRAVDWLICLSGCFPLNKSHTCCWVHNLVQKSFLLYI